ncbi:MAG: hypothetical protein ABI767_00705 [Rhodanobacter sp.]
MFDPSQHVIYSVNGRLTGPGDATGSSLADISRIVGAALESDDPALVIHFHGGLVNRAAGEGIARRLCPLYEGAPTIYPLFFVWESGLIESIKNNLRDIADDKLFQELIKKVARWALKQLPAGAALRGAGGQVDVEVLEGEFDAYFAGKGIAPLPSVFQLTGGTAPKLRGAEAYDSEAGLALDIQLALEGDDDFQAVLQDIHGDIKPSDVVSPSLKDNGVGMVVSSMTQISPSKVDQIFDITPNTKGIFAIGKVAVFIARIVWAVIRRYQSGRDHGPYTTIVEEVLAAAYIDKLGGVIWNQMKKDTADAFVDADMSVGAALLAAIKAEQIRAGKTFKRIVLIGHSTGAVYIANLIDSSAKILPDAKFEVVFLAPAITYARLAQTLQDNAHRIVQCRRFAMHDDVEAQDVLVPVIYPRSLLYLVSGVLEFSDGDAPLRVPDTPVVGMERFRLHPKTFTPEQFPEIESVEAFLAKFSNGSVWSVTDQASLDGLRSISRKHGDFDDDPDTVNSLVRILSGGF